MRIFLAAAFLCLASLSSVEAKPSKYPVDAFVGDRYVARTAQLGPEVARSVGCPPPCIRKDGKARYLYRAKKPPSSFKGQRRQVAPPHIAEHGTVEPQTVLGGFQREVGRAVTVASVGARFIRGRLICAVNVNAALAARGVRGTGSALAKSFLRWGRPTSPVPGAVAVFSRGRGGHVAIVHSVRSDGTVIYLNPSARRQAWTVGPYRKRPIAFRAAA